MPEFSTPALHAIEQTVEIESSSSSNTSLPLIERYEIQSTVDEILHHGYRTIALQFPDELLSESVLVYRALMRRLDEGGAGEGVQCFVLGDSTYGSCCPDILSCSHLPADFLVHYGHACLTPTDSIPVRYVFPKRSLDINASADALFDAASASISAKGKEKETHVLVVWDVGYDWMADSIADTFKQQARTIPHLNVIFSHINSQASHRSPALTTEQSGIDKVGSGSGGCCRGEPKAEPTGGCSTGQSCACQCSEATSPPSTSPHPVIDESEPSSSSPPPSLRSYPLPNGISIRECIIFYIGEETRGMVNLMMENAGNEIYQYDPSSQSTNALHTRTPLLLRRRFYTLHRALQSSVFGLLVHNVGLASSQILLKRLREVLIEKRRKSYTITVGRLNPAKLGNFEVVECWVMIGCREGGLVDGKDYYRPIITPYELLLALDGERGASRWKEEDWTLDFDRVLGELGPAKSTATSATDGQNDEDISSDDPDQPVFSLISGQYHSAQLIPSGEEAQGEENLPQIEAGAMDGTLVRRSREQALVKSSRKGVGAAADHLVTRSYQGLDPSEGYAVGDDGVVKFEPSVLEEGRAGIARGYREEEKHIEQ